MITLRIYLRAARKDAAGQSIIYFIVGEEWISSTCKVHHQHWDADNSCITKKHPKFYIINPIFQLYVSRAQQHISNLQTAGKSFDRAYFEQYVFTGPEVAENPCVLKLIDEYCNANNLGWCRIQRYRRLKFEIAFLVNAPKIKDINYAFAIRYQQLLRANKNNENSVIAKTKALKAIVHFAEKKGIIEKDPLAILKLKEIKGKKEHLSADELEILENLYHQLSLVPGLQTVLRYFLFSCYTGLRYSDIIKLNYIEIKNNCVVTTQEKTDKRVVVPLISKAKALLGTQATGNCFKTYSNQVTNRNLKSIMEIAGINKKISFHCSRHTFGTLSIFLGIPMEVVADLMGVDFKTVKIYAQIVDEVKSREMLKWEKKVG